MHGRACPSFAFLLYIIGGKAEEDERQKEREEAQKKEKGADIRRLTEQTKTL